MGSAKLSLKNKSTLRDAYIAFALRFDRTAFTIFPNILSFLMGTKVRFSFDRVLRSYFYETVGYERRIFFRHKSRAFQYLRGIRSRSDKLGKAYFLDNIDFRPGDLVIDCGANIGEMRHWFHIHKRLVEYIAFEPSPLEFAELKRNCPDDEVHNCGLWNAEGTLDFYLASEEADSSLIEPASYDSVISIPTRRLDSFVSRPVKLLKLEAEGAEPEILQGLGDKLQSVEYIAADVSFERGTKMESTIAPVTNYLLARNFELVGLHYPRLVALYKNTLHITDNQPDGS
jgi:FkbM family methyltransferase